MRFGRIAAFCAASAIAGTLAAPAFAQSPYDGNWHVTIVTKTGSCEPTASSMLTVADGKITAPGANVSGTIGREGTCESFDQWCICQRSTQRQRRIGKVEWSICRHTVQRAVGSIAPIDQSRLAP